MKRTDIPDELHQRLRDKAWGKESATKIPTLDEMKLAVAKLLPKLLTVRRCPAVDLQTEVMTTAFSYRWNDTGRRVTDREWLEICRLAEQSLRHWEKMTYEDQLTRFTANCSWPLNAGADQRLEAICRVKCPEMFSQT